MKTDVVREAEVLARRLTWLEEMTLRQYQSLAALFIVLTGIEDIASIRQPDVKAFRAEMPKSWGKSPKDQTATRSDVIAISAALPADKVVLSVGTINRHLEHQNQLAV